MYTQVFEQSNPGVCVEVALAASLRVEVKKLKPTMKMAGK